MKLSEFDMIFKMRATMMGLALANFVVDFTNVLERKEEMEPSDHPHGAYLSMGQQESLGQELELA